MNCDKNREEMDRVAMQMLQEKFDAEDALRIASELLVETLVNESRTPPSIKSGKGSEKGVCTHPVRCYMCNKKFKNDTAKNMHIRDVHVIRL